MIFHRKQRGHPSPTREIGLGNKVESRVGNDSFLGLIVDKNLTWAPQFNKMVKVLSKSVFILHKV